MGTRIVPLLRDHFALRLFDHQALTGEADDEIVVGDIQDFDALRSACQGVSAMLHLAAISDEDEFYTRLLPVNLRGVYNAFEAARQADVKKVLFASTGQTVLNYGKDWVSPEMLVRPSTVYACTKVFGEALARHYSDIHGMAMIVLRICWFQGYDSPLFREHPEMRTEWISPRDLTQLIVKCIRSEVRFSIFFGISNNTGRHFDIRNAQELVGYAPEDDAFKMSP